MRSIVKIAGLVSCIVSLASQTAAAQCIANTQSYGGRSGQAAASSAAPGFGGSAIGGYAFLSRSVAYDQLASMPLASYATYPSPDKPEPITITNSRQAQDAYGKGYQLYWNGRFDEALRYFSAAAASPESPALYWYYKGCAEYYLGKGDDSKKSFEKASKLQGDRKESAHEILLAFTRLQEKPLRDVLQGFIARAETKGS
jgi:tetratricopeptide (TPR) repeat protein